MIPDATMERMARPWPPSSAAARVSLRSLGLLGDAICVRDPRGRGPRPALVAREGGLDVHGGFIVRQSFAIAPEEGRAFVETSGDSNPIHVEDTVVPGAMTAARFILLPEVLLAGVRIRTLRIKFRAFSRYGRPAVNVYSLRPDGNGSFDVGVRSFQLGVLVAEGFLKGMVEDPPVPHRQTTREVIEAPSAEVVRAFLRSLRVAPDPYLAAFGYGYPRAFLAALPSGEMVRQGGAGGLLNVLDLEFPEAAVPSIVHESPRAEVRPTRPRNNFRRVLARVGSGIRTYCQGYATVLAAIVLGGPGTRPASS